jgi:hypothetical protein
LGACVAVAAAELLRPPLMKEHLLCHVCQIFLFLFRFLTACFLLRVFIIVTTTTTTTPMMVFALYLSIYLSILSILKRFVLAQILLSKLVPEDHRS